MAIPIPQLAPPGTRNAAIRGFGDDLRQAMLDQQRRDEALAARLAGERQAGISERNTQIGEANQAWEMAKQLEDYRWMWSKATSAANLKEREFAEKHAEAADKAIASGDLQAAQAIMGQAPRPPAPSAAPPQVAAPAPKAPPEPKPQFIKPNGQTNIPVTPRPVQGASALPPEIDPAEGGVAQPAAGPVKPDAGRSSRVVQMAAKLAEAGFANDRPRLQLEVAKKFADAGMTEIPTDQGVMQQAIHEVMSSEQPAPAVAPPVAPAPLPGPPAPQPTSDQRMAAMVMGGGGRPAYSPEALSRLSPQMRAMMAGGQVGPGFDQRLQQFGGMVREAAGEPKVMQFGGAPTPDVRPIMEARVRRWGEIIDDAEKGATSLTGRLYRDEVRAMAPKSAEAMANSDPDNYLKDVFHKYGKQPPPVSVIGRGNLDLSKDMAVEAKLNRVVTNLKIPANYQEMNNISAGINQLGTGSVGPEQAAAIMHMARQANGPGVLTDKDLSYAAKGRAGVFNELKDWAEGKRTGKVSEDTAEIMRTALQHGLTRTIGEAKKAKSLYESRAVGILRDPRYGMSYEPTATGIHETYFGWLPGYETPNWVGLQEAKPQGAQGPVRAVPPRAGGSVTVGVRGPADVITGPKFQETTSDLIKALKVQGKL